MLRKFALDLAGCRINSQVLQKKIASDEIVKAACHHALFHIKFDHVAAGTHNASAIVEAFRRKFSPEILMPEVSMLDGKRILLIDYVVNIKLLQQSIKKIKTREGCCDDVVVVYHCGPIEIKGARIHVLLSDETIKSTSRAGMNINDRGEYGQ